MAVTVKVVRVPGAVTEVVLNDGATVADALSAAGTSLGDGEAVTINGATAGNDTPVSEGARVVIAKGAKGNS